MYKFYIGFYMFYVGVYMFYIGVYMFYIRFYRFYIGFYSSTEELRLATGAIRRLSLAKKDVFVSFYKGNREGTVIPPPPVIENL